MTMLIEIGEKDDKGKVKLPENKRGALLVTDRRLIQLCFDIVLIEFSTNLKYIGA